MNKTYKICAVDVDGTLVNNKKEITDNVKKAIQEVNKNNKIITIATGRPLSGLSPYLKYFDDQNYFITYNGAKIVDKQNNCIYNKYMSKEDSDLLIDYAYNNHLNIIIWNDDILYVNEYNDSIKFYESTSFKNAIIHSYEELISKQFCKINKIILYGEESILKTHKQILQLKSNTMTIEFSSKEYLEFFDKSVSKGNALKVLCDKFNISYDETIAIGDNYNDLSMIMFASLGVAMANSPEDVKKKSDYITFSNEEDGVAHIINNFMIKEG